MKTQSSALSRDIPELHKTSLRLLFLLKSYSLSNYLALVGIIFTSLSVAYYANFLKPQTVQFSYAQPTCVNNFVLLPKLHNQAETSTYKATMKPLASVGNYPLASKETCVELKQLPDKSSQTIKIAPATLMLTLEKSIRIEPQPLPKLAPQKIKPKSQPINKPLSFKLSSPDKLLSYRLHANNNQVQCQKPEPSFATCDLKRLNLKQGKSYTLKLYRNYHGKSQKLAFRKKIKTIAPVQVKSSSIKAGSVVTGKPRRLVLKFNKKLKTFQPPTLRQVSSQKPQKIPTKASTKGKQLIINLKEPLPRRAKFKLKLANATARDNSFLPQAYSLSFKTSGGPRVVSINLPKHGASVRPIIKISFSAGLKANQNLQQIVRITARGKPVDFQVSAYGSYLTLNTSLPRCAPFTVSINNNLQNSHGISGGSSWSYQSRTICRKAFSIGQSHQGRPILAYSFGNGKNTIIYVGATHGNEASSKYTLDSFLGHLEANYSSIPANKKIVVIPSLNPDGIAAGMRTNARNIDLNRNFPANNWKSDVTMPDGSLNKNGGGKKPLSEPESAAIANYILSQNPQLVVSYHAVGGLVIGNNNQNAAAIARTYAAQSGLSAVSYGHSSDLFNYDTTGAMTDWLHDKTNIPALLVELRTYGGNEFYTHKNAMWHLVK